MYSEYDGESFYGFVDKDVHDEHDPLAQFQLLPLKSSFSEKEIDYFKVIIEHLLDGEIESKTIMTFDDKKLTASQKQTFIRHLVAEKWLLKVDDKYFIGPRTQLSLREYLIHLIGDENHTLPLCSFCKKEAIVFQLCPSCQSPIHRYCYHQSHFCPQCKVQWGK